jgi:hypothetical protein
MACSVAAKRAAGAVGAIPRAPTRAPHPGPPQARPSAWPAPSQRHFLCREAQICS